MAQRTRWPRRRPLLAVFALWIAKTALHVILLSVALVWGLHASSALLLPLGALLFVDGLEAPAMIEATKPSHGVDKRRGTRTENAHHALLWLGGAVSTLYALVGVVVTSTTLSECPVSAHSMGDATHALICHGAFTFGVFVAIAYAATAVVLQLPLTALLVSQLPSDKARLRVGERRVWPGHATGVARGKMCHVLRCTASSLGVAIKMVALMLLSVLVYFIGYLYGVYREYSEIQATVAEASEDASDNDVVSFAEEAADRAWYYAYRQYSGDAGDDSAVHQWAFLFWSVYVAAVIVYGVLACFCSWNRCARDTTTLFGDDRDKPKRVAVDSSDGDESDEEVAAYLNRERRTKNARDA